MLSYRYARQSLDGNRMGHHRRTPEEVNLLGYSQVPIDQEIDVHRVSARWAPFERLTLVVSVPILVKQMTQLDFDNGGLSYTTRSTAVGDVEVVALLPFIKKGDESLDLHFGLNIPTDGIDEKDQSGELLPFPMQADSSTWNILAGFTYSGHHEGFGWGLQAEGEVGFGSNARSYRGGDRIDLSGWLGQELTPWLSGTVRMEFRHLSRLRNEGSSGPLDHPSSFASNSGSDRVWLGPGLSVALPVLGVQRLSFEALWPVFQSVNGSQLDADWTLTTRWEWTF